MDQRTHNPNSPIHLTILAPAHNEQDNVDRLVSEVFAALDTAGVASEFIIVDDCSTDQTADRVLRQMASHPRLRLISMQRDGRTPPGKGNGQSAAFYAGIRAAQGEFIGMLDADLQNDPAEFIAMLKLQRQHNADLVQGDRSHARKDNFVRRASSAVGRFFRKLILADVVRDTGCSLRILRTSYARQLPLQFRGTHRFIPIGTAHLGGSIVQMPVNHRPRIAGETKYGFGITQRAIPGLVDCFAMRWMDKRRRSVRCNEIASQTAAQTTAQTAAVNTPQIHTATTAPAATPSGASHA